MNTSTLLGHIEMGAYVATFRGLAIVRPIADLVRTAAEYAGRLQRSDREGPASDYVQMATVAAGRASRLVPGATCLHRALAARVWLARRGISSEIVVGFRKDGQLEGHAWLEVAAPDGPVAIFEQDGYRESFREHGAIERASDASFFP